MTKHLDWNGVGEGFSNISSAEMSKSIVKGIGIGFLSCIGIGIGIAKTISQVLVLVLVLLR